MNGLGRGREADREAFREAFREASSDKMSSEKLTKKQQKALQFRKSKDVKTEEVKEVKEVKQVKEVNEASAEPVKKKRKTRRGKKGKGQAGSSGNRFLVFVGGLPNNVTPNELTAHFKSSAPDHIRIRNDKHIAFLEFDGDKDPTGIQRRMDMALLQTGTELREGKKLNVELTVGGGGNSQDRLAKLQKKNEKLQLETTARLEKLKSKGKAAKPDPTTSSTGTAASASAPGIHPDRQRLLQK